MLASLEQIGAEVGTLHPVHGVCFGEPNPEERPEAQRLFSTVDAVLATPEFAARRSDDQVKAISVVEFAGFVGGFGVLDLLDR